MEPSRRIFSENIKDPDLALCIILRRAIRRLEESWYCTRIVFPGRLMILGNLLCRGITYRGPPLQIILTLNIARRHSDLRILNGGLKALAAQKYEIS